jgi:hypothetical protein
MKKYSLLLIMVMALNLAFAEKLVLVNYYGTKELKSLFADKELRINYFCDNFVIATVCDDFAGEAISIDDNCWKGSEYFISWFHKGIKDNYPSQVADLAEILVEMPDYLILKAKAGVSIHPPVDGCIVRINNTEVNLPQIKLNYSKGSVKNDPDIEAMIDSVNIDLFMEHLQHLQDYGTRNAYTPQAVEAQNWIKQQFESYGYSVELFDFTMPGGSASDNVIATKTGNLYPDEYVVIGGHYDSYSFSGNAPGADDDGSGVCGVMEVARVMADFETDRTVLFCAWSGEEYGLYGSEAYATWCENQGLNILGYFNIDMCGYLNPGDPIHTDIIAPASAQPLEDFYTDVCAMYLPDFIVGPGNLSGGDSDHTSFNNHGYMGIFPFEDSQNYSPYIHTSDDVIGLSVNSPEMAGYFTKAMVANVATLANWLAPPANLVGVPGDNLVMLSWDPVADIEYYNVYKNNGTTPIASITETNYTDTDVVNFTTYSYYVTVVYSESGEESDPSNTVTVTPLPPMIFPFIDDFESGALYWSFEGTWGLTTSQSHSATHSITESPNGNYGNNLEISAYLYNFSLEDAESAEMSFWTRYSLEDDYDYMYLQISTNGSNWNNLETFNGNVNTWTQKTYDLNAYLGEPLVLIRFRFESDSYVTENGMFIDDFMLDVQGTGSGISDQSDESVSVEIFPNPASGFANVMISNVDQATIEIRILAQNGATILKEILEPANNPIVHELPTEGMVNGIYYCIVRCGDHSKVSKLSIIR